MSQGEKYACLARIMREPRPWTAGNFGPIEWLPASSIDPVLSTILPDAPRALTAQAVRREFSVLYQPVFETATLTTACDILVWREGVFDLYEVKASTNGEGKGAKEDLYVHDMAFQRLVLEANGVDLRRCYLVRLDGGYPRAELAARLRAGRNEYRPIAGAPESNQYKSRTDSGPL